MTNGDASSVSPRDDPGEPPTPTTSSTDLKVVWTPATTWSLYADRITTELTSQDRQTTGARSSSRSWPLRRLLHVFGRHDFIPFELWDIVNDEVVLLDFDVCTICPEQRSY